MNFDPTKFQLISNNQPIGFTFPALYQVKHDGMRAYCINSGIGPAVFHTRGGLTLEIDLDLPIGIYDGELLIDGLAIHQGNISRSEANGLYNSAFKSTGRMPDGWYFMVFDLIHCDMIYQDKIKALDDISWPETFEPVETMHIRSEEELPALYKRALSLDLEGYVIKSPLLTWSEGRTRQAYKIKISRRMKMKIIDFVPGKGRLLNKIGALKVQGLGTKSHIQANVGTGLTDAQRSLHWSLGRTVMVEYQTMTETSLLHTRFLWII